MTINSVGGRRLLVGRPQRGRQITTGVQDSPDVDLVIADDAERGTATASSRRLAIRPLSG